MRVVRGVQVRYAAVLKHDKFGQKRLTSIIEEIDSSGKGFSKSSKVYVSPQ